MNVLAGSARMGATIPCLLNCTAQPPVRAVSCNEIAQPLFHILPLSADSDVHASLSFRIRRRWVCTADEQVLGKIHPAFRTSVVKTAQHQRPAQQYAMNSSSSTRWRAIRGSAYVTYTVEPSRRSFASRSAPFAASRCRHFC